MKQSLARRYSLISAFVTVLVGSFVLLINLYYLGDFAEQTVDSGQQHLTSVIEKQMLHDAELVTATLARNLDIDVYNLDFTEIGNKLASLSKEGNVLYTYVYDQDGRIIHDGTPEVSGYGRPVADFLPHELSPTMTPEARHIGHHVHVASPIKTGHNTFAMLRTAIAYDQAEADIDRFTQTLADQAGRIRDNVTITMLSTIALVLCISTLTVFVLSQRLLQPIRLLAGFCHRYSEGEKEIQFKLPRQDEIGHLSHALEEMKAAIAESHSRIEQLAYLDPLTHLPNRRMFNEELQSLVNWTDRHQGRLAVLFIDLDHFKDINDTAGHETGDKLLKLTAERLTALIRAQEGLPDFPLLGDLLLARLGGDEFVMLLPQYRELEDLERLCQQIKQLLEDGFTIDGQRFHISASIGITRYPENADNHQELLKQADIAMYSAKRSGRSGHAFYHPEMDIAITREVSLIRDFRQALEEGQLSLAYQPICDLQSGELIGAEALLRWQHPQQGAISPGQFIPVIEKTDLIRPLTLWVLEQARQDLQEHFLERHPRFKLSVNISGSVLQDADTCREISSKIRQWRLPAHRLHLEITETSMMENIQLCAEILAEWKKTGADIWVDDFGTGYSSLNYLHSLPIDGLKIDRSFVDGLGRGQNQIVDTILTLAKSLELETIAEGIETNEQLKHLRNTGCDHAQGYLFSRPVPLNIFVDTFINHVE